jgi:hypothetical protein
MKRFVALSLVALAAPALAEPEQKTELVDLKGQQVDLLLLRHEFGRTWVVDNQNVLWRDMWRDYYLVTLRSPCMQLEVRQRFQFHPRDPWRLQSNRSYELRHHHGPVCDVARIAQIDDDRANTLRDVAARRVGR